MNIGIAVARGADRWPDGVATGADFSMPIMD